MNATARPEILITRSSSIEPSIANYAAGDPSLITGPSGHDHLLIEAKPLEVVKLFPPYIADAIKWVNGIPAVSMNLPNETTSKFGCQMSLEVKDNKVQHIAKELFDAHLETTGGLQYVYLERGTRIVPSPRCTLQGCKREKILVMFGAEIDNAIRASAQYQEELHMCKIVTQSVSMVISQAAHDGGWLILVLEMGRGADIRDKLYN